jgi:hypothetical protein
MVTGMLAVMVLLLTTAVSLSEYVPALEPADELLPPLPVPVPVLVPVPLLQPATPPNPTTNSIATRVEMTPRRRQVASRSEAGIQAKRGRRERQSVMGVTRSALAVVLRTATVIIAVDPVPLAASVTLLGETEHVGG